MNEDVAPAIDFVRAIRPADVLDIAIVALIAYVVLGWAQRAHSRFIFGGLAALAGTYVVARVLDLRLTLFIFQLVITVAVVAIVVIFQEDLRRGFERLGQRPLRGRRAVGDRDRLIDVLSTASGTLAKHKSGALIVLKGSDPLGRHLSGGVSLDGAPSEPLLLSIFDPSSAGHDGAVIVDADRITRFGVHLPLSHNVPGGRKLGTRHAAALGLAERSDALVIAVSEERGVISVAENGAIEEMSDTSALRARLDVFFGRYRPEPRTTRARRFLFERLWLKVVALALAFAGWMVIYGLEREQMIRSFTVPVALHDLPPNWMVSEHEPSQARITVTGPTRAFRELDPGSLVVSLSARELKPGRQQRALTPRVVDVPQPLRVLAIEPNWVRFTAFETETVLAEVDVKTTGTLPRGLKLVGVRPEPPKIKLVVRKGSAERHATIPTVPVDLSTVAESTRREVALDPHGSTWLADRQASSVSLRITVAGDGS